MSDVDMDRVGATIRAAREAAGLSMDALADKAGISASTLHRIEHGSATKTSAVKKPMASKLAQILVVLNFDHGSQLTHLLGGGEYAAEVRHWMATADARSYNASRRLEGQPEAPRVDLMALSPDGTVFVVQVAGEQPGARDRFARELRQLGYVVTMSVNAPDSEGVAGENGA